MSERRSELKAVNTPAEQAAAFTGQDLGRLASAWLDNWGQIGGHLVSLAQTGLRHSLDAADQLRQCQSPTEAVDLQIKLARQAYDDYLDEARTLSELVMKLSSDALATTAASRQTR